MNSLLGKILLGQNVDEKKSDGRSRKLGEKFWWKIFHFLILPGQIMTS